MSKKILSVIGWGFAGLVVALGLTAGAFALAGQNLDDPLEPPVFPETSQTDGPSPSDDGSRSPQAERSDSPSPSVDDHGGDNDGSDNSGSDDGDNSGPGSDGDGSDDSGSGSDNSGSGSDNSGSGSGDDHDDD